MVRFPWSSSDATDGSTGGCGCRVSFVEPSGTGVGDRVELHVDAEACTFDGDLAAAPPCRATVVEALTGRDAAVIRVRSAGRERTYADGAAGLLLAAGRFAALAVHHDETLASTAMVDPLSAAREATGRAGPLARLAAETGLAEGAARAEGYAGALPSHVGPTVARSRVDARPLDFRPLRNRRELPTGATVTVYGDTVSCLDSDAESDAEFDSNCDLGSDSGRDSDRTTSTRRVPDSRYNLSPVEASFDAGAYRILDAATTSLTGDDATFLREGGSIPATNGRSSPSEAIRGVLDEFDTDVSPSVLSAVLRKHTQGAGVLDDLFADERVSDVYVTAPAHSNPVRVVVDGESMATNVRLTPGGVAALASRLRRESGRGFSRATPRIDATLSLGPNAESVRAAGVTRPLADGPAYAFRRHDTDAWTLERLVACQSLTPRAAALLSLAVRRGATGLVAGARGAGKTTTLGALLWAVPRRTRTVVVEDTPELPLAGLQAAGRDVQGLRVARGDDDATVETTPGEALRTALRLGEGALVVGEVRGEEATVLYEAMRVGAAASTVLGTVHGEGASAVRTRLTEDLGVSDQSFAATDFVLSVADTPRGRRVVALEEVRATTTGTELATLFELNSGGDLQSTGVLDRGESALLDGFANPDAGERYVDVLSRLASERERFETLATNGVTTPRERLAFDEGRS